MNVSIADNHTCALKGLDTDKLSSGQRLKLQLEEDAKQMGMSLHAFMVSTLADAAQRKRLRQTFAQDSADALALMKSTGTGHALDDVRLYFSQLKAHRQEQAEPPAPLQVKRMG